MVYGEQGCLLSIERGGRMSWESPIDVYTISNEMRSALDDEIVTVVQRFGFDVNKEELTKALLYDRGQYEKGYTDGRPPKGEWVDGYYGVWCSVCKQDHEYRTPYCPNCGADMRTEDRGGFEEFEPGRFTYNEFDANP